MQCNTPAPITPATARILNSNHQKSRAFRAFNFNLMFPNVMCPPPENQGFCPKYSPGLNIYDNIEKENSQNRCFNRKYPVIHSALSSDQITHFRPQKISCYCKILTPCLVSVPVLRFSNNASWQARCSLPGPIIISSDLVSVSGGSASQLSRASHTSYLNISTEFYSSPSLL